MRIVGPESKPSTHTIMPEEVCMVRCIEGIEGGGINAPPINLECVLMLWGGSCRGHEPSTWLRAPLAYSRALSPPGGPHYHPDRGRVNCSYLANAVLKCGVLRFLLRDAEEIRSHPGGSYISELVCNLVFLPSNMGWDDCLSWYQ